MDRRQKKTRKAIIESFKDLLGKKRYESITVNDIIKGANVGRSTFYSHFVTKDALLKTLCTEILEHVFSESLTQESAHNFSEKDKSLRNIITHIMHHLYEDKKNIRKLLNSSSGNLFINYLQEHISVIFEKNLDLPESNIPKEYTLNHLKSSFSETIRWWMKSFNSYTPVEITSFYFFVNQLK